MRDYLVWMDTSGYWVREAWSQEKNEMTGEGRLYLFDHQRRILGHTLTFGENERLPYETVLYSATKKSGKTAVAASVGAWYAEEGKPGTEIYIIANSYEQGAGRVFRDVAFHFKKRQEQFGKHYCKIGEYKIDFPNGTFIQVLSNSFAAAAGSRHSLTLFDELWGSVTESDRRLWDEMTPIPTVTNSLRFISTYAGFENESELLWELYLRGVGTDEHVKGTATPVSELYPLPCWKNGKMFTYWTHEPSMPWQTEEYLNEQMASERPAAYLRLHLNQWVTSHEEFIPVEWWDSAAKAFPDGNAEIWQSHPFARWPIFVGIDAGIKRDSTALVAVGYDSARGKVGLVTHKIWSPKKGDPVNIDETVEVELKKLYNKFNLASVVYDPTHLLPTMGRLKNLGIPTHQFDQTSANMTAASQLLYDLFKNRNLEAYPADDLRRHIQMSVAETSSRGFRIKKTRTAKTHQIDGCIALAMACYAAVTSGGVDITVPLVLASPFSDATAWVTQEEDDIPFELRTE